MPIAMGTHIIDYEGEALDRRAFFERYPSGEVRGEQSQSCLEPLLQDVAQYMHCDKGVQCRADLMLLQCC